MHTVNRLTIGIDASNIRAGGGITHLVELLRFAQPEMLNIGRIVIWGGAGVLRAIDDRGWLDKRLLPALDRGLFSRIIWQRTRLSQLARDEGCDVLFVPGGCYTGDFHPVVTMSQNLLPFDMRELLRYGLTFFSFKLLLLRFAQSRSFRKSDGVIFLTEYARETVLKITGKLKARTSTIPHGLNTRFNCIPKLQRPIADYKINQPLRIIYVSTIDLYKHQWRVVEAVFHLRNQGFPIMLDLVGAYYTPALKLLNEAISRFDPDQVWVKYHGPVPYSDLDLMYGEADIAIWSSTCETFGIILLEAMASGLPVACSSKQPTPEIVGGAAIYFDPENADDICKTLQRLIESPQLRTELSQAGYFRAQTYSWTRCASETFEFLCSVVSHQ